MQKITPFLWFDNNAEEAVTFYTSIFPDSKVGAMSRLPEGSPSPGTVITGTITLAGQEFMVLNGGPHFKFNEAVSFFVSCKDQKEVDYYWNKLTADGGQESQCGWLKDKFGLSWQIVPDILGKLLSDKDGGKAGRAMQAMLKMKKLDIATLQKAFDGQ